MRFSKRFLVACSVFMSFMLSNIPALAMSSEAMISTEAALAEMNRAQTEQQIADFLSREDVKAALIEKGVAPDEVNSRLASLSESELRALSGQVEQARAGGDILVTVLVILLIIFLVKRI
jgi:hypothetical protein